VIHDRFWMPGLAERLCHCSNGRECPWQWTKTLDNSTLSLNNRSVLKVSSDVERCTVFDRFLIVTFLSQFCTHSLAELETCAHRQEAVIVYGETDTSNSYVIPYNVTVNCACPQTHYWKLQKYTYEENGDFVQVFRCVRVGFSTFLSDKRMPREKVTKAFSISRLRDSSS